MGLLIRSIGVMACPGATPTNVRSNFYRVCDHDIIFFDGNIRSGPGSIDSKNDCFL